MIPKLQACLWFEDDIEQVAAFYAATFPDSRIHRVMRAPADYPGGQQGDVLTVEMTILGQPFLLLQGGPQFKFNNSVSFIVATDDQAETDRYWHALTTGGGEESQCGWCKDKHGLSWQVTPKRLTELLAQGGDTAARAFAAMMDMEKIEIAALERAVA